MSASSIYPNPYHPREVQIVIWIFYASALLTFLEGIWGAMMAARYGLGGGGAILTGIIFAAIDFGAGYFLNNYRTALAYWVAIVLLALGFLSSLISLFAAPLMAILGLAISGYGIYLLWRPHVQAYYGVSTAGLPAPVQPPQQAQPAAQGQTPPRCPVCGGPLVYVPQYRRWYCPKCKRYY